MNHIVATVLAAVFGGVGVLVSLTGAVGVIRMPDLYTRIQCSSKTVTLGVIPTLLGLVFAEGAVTAYGGRALLITLMLLVLNPAASHALARASYKVGVPMWPGSVTDQPREASEKPT